MCRISTYQYQPNRCGIRGVFGHIPDSLAMPPQTTQVQGLSGIDRTQSRTVR